VQEDVSTQGLSLIDEETFFQILDLDDDDETHEFSWSMVLAYFEQAEETFRDMDDAVSGS
jgi:osomolarity two-component system phosphorelay intermediate protein YPD1